MSTTTDAAPAPILAIARGPFRSYVTDPLLWPIVRTLPGITEALTVAADAKTAIDHHHRHNPEAFDAAGMIAAGVLDLDLIDAEAARRATGSTHEHTGNLLEDLRARATHRLEEIAKDHQSDLLDHLRGELDTVVTDATAILDQHDIVTAAEAINAGSKGAAAWRTLTEHATHYGRIRLAQTIVGTHTLPGDVINRATNAGRPGFPAWCSDWHLSNLDQQIPTYAATHPAATRDHTGARVGNRPGGYPVDAAGRRTDIPAGPTDPTELLVWLLRAGFQPWIPTRADLTAVWERRHEHQNELIRAYNQSPDGKAAAAQSPAYVPPWDSIEARRDRSPYRPEL